MFVHATVLNTEVSVRRELDDVCSTPWSTCGRKVTIKLPFDEAEALILPLTWQRQVGIGRGDGIFAVYNSGLNRHMR